MRETNLLTQKATSSYQRANIKASDKLRRTAAQLSQGPPGSCYSCGSYHRMAHCPKYSGKTQICKKCSNKGTLACACKPALSQVKSYVQGRGHKQPVIATVNEQSLSCELLLSNILIRLCHGYGVLNFHSFRRNLPKPFRAASVDGDVPTVTWRAHTSPGFRTSLNLRRRVQVSCTVFYT